MSRGETEWPSLGTSYEAFIARREALRNIAFGALHVPKDVPPSEPREFTSADRLIALPFASVFRQLCTRGKSAWAADIAAIVETGALGARTKRITGALSAEATREPEFGKFFSFEPNAEGTATIPSGLFADTLGAFSQYVEMAGLQIVDIGPETRDRIVDLAGRLAVKFETERPPVTGDELWQAQCHPQFYVK